jgi:hypothetical protein
VGRLLPDAGSTQPSVMFEIDAPSGTLFEIQVLVGSPTYDPFPGNNKSSVQFEYVPPN